MKQLLVFLFVFCSSIVIAQEQGEPIYHIVVPGNTFYGIATANKVPLEVMKNWNKMPDYKIKVGQKLIVGYTKPDKAKPEELAAPAATPKLVEKAAEPVKPIVEEPIQKTETYWIFHFLL